MLKRYPTSSWFALAIVVCISTLSVSSCNTASLKALGQEGAEVFGPRVQRLIVGMGVTVEHVRGSVSNLADDVATKIESQVGQVLNFEEKSAIRSVTKQVICAFDDQIALGILPTQADVDKAIGEKFIEKGYQLLGGARVYMRQQVEELIREIQQKGFQAGDALKAYCIVP